MHNKSMNFLVYRKKSNVILRKCFSINFSVIEKKLYKSYIYLSLLKVSTLFYITLNLILDIILINAIKMQTILLVKINRK